MALDVQPRPWTPLPGREIADGAGNVVQYTQGTIGQICLAVNSHDRLIDIVSQVETFFRTPPKQRPSEKEILTLLSGATGRIGYGALASKIEDAEAASPDLDRAISVELDVPEAPYTSSSEAARSLIAKGSRISDWEMDRLNPATGQPVTYIVVEIRSGEQTCTATSITLPLAICAAALRTKEL